MKNLKLVARWLFQAWPLWAVSILIAGSMWFFYLFNVDKVVVQRIGILLQSAGAFAVLYSLNKNMGVFKQAGFFKRAVSWITAFPLIKKGRAVVVAGAIQEQFSIGSPTLQQWNDTWTPERKIDELKNRIATCFEEAKRMDKAVREKIEAVRVELKTDLQKSDNKITEMKSQLVSVTIGSVNLQFFGVLLAIYGTVLLI